MPRIPCKLPARIVLPIERREFLGLILAGLATTLPMDPSQAATMRTVQDKARVLSTLSAYVDVLIPADDQTPAASSLGIADRIVAEARESALFLRLLQVVTNWLNKSPSDFASLAEDRKIALLEWMSSAPWECPQRRYFEIVRDRAMWFYYGSAESWGGLSIHAPPQPVGYTLE